MARIQLYFNGNFSLKKEELNKIIQTASEEKGLNDNLENLMGRTSLGNAKVGRIKSWAIRSGLVKKNHLSPEGEIIWRIDPLLESIVTDWFIHFYLSFGDKGLQPIPDEPADWGGWSYFIYDFLPSHKNFTEEEFIQYSSLVFEEDSKVIAQRIRYILRAYTEPQALAACKFLTEENNQYLLGNARLPNPYLIGYFLAKLWERDFKGQGSVLTESILNQKMGLAPMLSLKTEALQELLNTLDDYGIIEHQRAVPPFHVIPRWDNPLTLLEKAYDSDR
jgi:Protein of unknown function (DUF4007)